MTMRRSRVLATDYKMAVVFGYLLLIVIAFIQVDISNAYRCSQSCGQYAYCCGNNICCHHRTSYTFYSVWYFWFIIALLIMACAGSCSYYRKRHRLLTVRRNVPVAVVTFTNGNQEHGPVDIVMPPSYQEATSKPIQYPPPYYTPDFYANSQMHSVNARLPPYPG